MEIRWLWKLEEKTKHTRLSTNLWFCGFFTLVYCFCSCRWNSEMKGSFSSSCLKWWPSWMNACNFPFTPLWHMTFDLSTHPDCSEVWPSERGGAQAVDPGHHWSLHRPGLPERDEEWSHSVRVRTSAEPSSTKESQFHSRAVLVHFQRGQQFGLRTLALMLSSCLLIGSGKWLPAINDDDYWSGKSIFLFLSDLLTNSPRALWKRSTSLHWTGIR